jgi:ATP phosphoribosyltransferase
MVSSSLVLPGGVFTAHSDGKDWMLTRDGDMTTCLEEKPTGLGFMGSDRFRELRYKGPPARYAFYPLVETAIRFAFATTPEKVDRFQAKIEGCQDLVIATTYPRGAREGINELGDAARLAQGVSARDVGMSHVETLDIDGSVEAAPAMFERVDAVFDVVDTGRTIDDNESTIVFDNLGRLSVGAICTGYAAETA